MKYHEYRTVKITAYTHKLNRPLVEAFVKMTEFFLEKKRPCNINTELGLTHNQKANFQKLRHFGIVLNAEDGAWLPTPNGLAFYRGELSIPDTAGSIGNDTLSPEHPAWRTHRKVIKTVYVHDLYALDRRYVHRDEYREQKSGQASFF